jgi:hypothetical protein
MTGPEHWREAEQLTGQASAVMDADYGWMASLSTEERLQRRAAYLADAQVHATLGLTAAVIAGITMQPADRHEWQKAIDPDYAAEQAPGAAL